VDEITWAEVGSVANKTKPDNQSLGLAVFVRLTGTPQKVSNVANRGLDKRGDDSNNAAALRGAACCI
jgi:hypothetical protein